LSLLDWSRAVNSSIEVGLEESRMQLRGQTYFVL
jgi:hypothetical protein